MTNQTEIPYILFSETHNNLCTFFKAKDKYAVYFLARLMGWLGNISGRSYKSGLGFPGEVGDGPHRLKPVSVRNALLHFFYQKLISANLAGRAKFVKISACQRRFPVLFHVNNLADALVLVDQLSLAILPCFFRQVSGDSGQLLEEESVQNAPSVTRAGQTGFETLNPRD